MSLASHFDGGCPCESGMSIQLSAGGTCNAELAATFAPRPQLIVSDGGDWTASVPTLEFPYLQRIYGFYQAKDKVTNGDFAGHVVPEIFSRFCIISFPAQHHVCVYPVAELLSAGSVATESSRYSTFCVMAVG